MKKIFLTAFVLLGLIFISQAQIKYKIIKTKYIIGDKFGGGIVFDVSADGLHGLIAETIDQGRGDWEQAIEIAKTGTHNADGKAFTDWRLPTRDELNKLYQQRVIVGGFINDWYWSSTGGGSSLTAWMQYFSSGEQVTYRKDNIKNVRAVRAF